MRHAPLYPHGMTPDELRLLTDPAARNDPDFARRVRAQARQRSRGQVFTMLRTVSLVMGLVGLSLLGVCGLIAVGALLSPYVPGISVPPDALFPAAFMSVFGVVTLGLCFWLWTPSRALLDTGLEGHAQVLQVLDISGGLSVKGSIRASLSNIKVQLRVLPPNGAPYELVHRERILDTDIAALQVGATLPVRIAPGNPQKLLIDWSAAG